MPGSTDATEFILRIAGGAEGNLAGGGGGPAGAGGGGGGASKEQNAIQRELDKLNKTTSKSLGATLGIKLGAASILKQSQVFTGFIGTIFQLMGAMVDVILAPFLPVLIPGIRKMAELIPYISKYSQAIFDWLDRGLFNIIRDAVDGLLPGKFKDKIVPALAALIVGMFFLRMTGLWGPFSKIVTEFIANPLWKLFSTFIGKPLWNAFNTFMLDPLWKLLLKKIPFLDKLVFKFTQEGMIGLVKAGLTRAWKYTGKVIVDFLSDTFKIWVDDVGRIGKTVLGFIFKPIWAIAQPLLTNIDNFLGRFPSRIGTWIWHLISGPFKAFIKVQKGSLIDRFVAFFKNIYRNTIKGLVDTIKEQIGNFVNWLARKFIEVTRPIGELAENIVAKLGNMPVVKWALKFFSKGSMLGRAAGAIGSGVAKYGAMVKGAVTPGGVGKGLKVLGMSMKGVPIIGAAAELGFGGWQTYQDYQKYGAKAAMARGALTLANTGTALIDPTGIASAAGSIGSNIALGYGMSKKFDVKEEWALKNRELVVRLVTETGEVRYVMKNNVDADQGVTLDTGMAVARASMDANDIA